MLPNPLHPAVVHFPIVLMFLLPISAAVALWAIRGGARVSRAWLVPVAVAAALALSSWVAVETGEEGKEGAERTAAERFVESHEEAAERFLALSSGLLIVLGAGLLRGRAGQALRVGGAVASVALIVAGYQVGHSGGELVYTHGIGPVASQVGTAPSVRGEH